MLTDKLPLEMHYPTNRGDTMDHCSDETEVMGLH